MAKTSNNIFVRGMSGSVGDQFVIRTTRYGQTIISNMPTFDPDREFTTLQKAHQQAFREATAYAKSSKKQAVYMEKVKGTPRTTYNLAISDWFGKPEVLEINTSGWTGEAGQTIRIKAQDNIHVASVTVTIGDAGGQVFEQGEAARSDGLWWVYTAMNPAALTPETRVTAVVKDLPGNRSDRVWEKR